MSTFNSTLMVGTPQRTAFDQAKALRSRLTKTPIALTFVRLLAAWDEYEINVLKALFHYRPPNGAVGPPEERMFEYADEFFDDGRVEPYPEKPRSLMYANPPLTDWLRHAVQEPDERRWAFEKTFGIELAIGESEEVRFAYHCHRDTCYSRRQGIAHGEANIHMTPAEYRRADVFVCRSFAHLAAECRTKQMLIV